MESSVSEIRQLKRWTDPKPLRPLPSSSSAKGARFEQARLDGDEFTRQQSLTVPKTC
jgi:hypothetical protein